MTEKKISRGARGAGNKLLGFGFVTLLWLVCASYLIWHTKDAAVSSQVCISHIPCLTPNEWGDLLSGLFAPIAFLWLVATVWIQSDELRSQREELVLTRLEMEHNREVMKEQAEESRRQAEFVGTQTSILKQSQVDEELKAFLSVFQHWVLHKFHLTIYAETGGRFTPKDIGYLTEQTPADPLAFFKTVCSRLEAAIKEQFSPTERKLWARFIEETSEERRLIPSYLKEVAAYQGRVSPHLQMLISTTNVQTLGTLLSGILNTNSTPQVDT